MPKENDIWSEYNIRMTLNVLRGTSDVQLDHPTPQYPLTPLEIGDHGQYQQALERRIAFSQALTKLSSEAKEIIELIFSMPSEIADGLTQRKLTEMLRTKGWSFYKAKRGFWTISKMLKGLDKE